MTGTVASNSYPLEIANKNNDNTTFFNGKIREVAIWNKALSQDEITQLYNSGSGLSASRDTLNYNSSSNLQGYWKFNDGSGNTAKDMSSNGNNGTVYSASWSGGGSAFNWTYDNIAPTMTITAANSCGSAVSSVPQPMIQHWQSLLPQVRRPPTLPPAT